MANPLGCIPGAQTGLIDFNSISIDSDILLNTLSKETPNFQFKWSTRSDRPQISQTPGVINLKTEGLTTIIYNQHEYYLTSIQFAQSSQGKGTHTSLISPKTNQLSNKEDIILTFTDINIIIGDQQHIVIVVPIIRNLSGLSVDPDYLHAIYSPDSVSAERGITIESLIPKGPYVSYTICTPRIGVAGSNQNLMIMVSMYGLPVINASILNILQGQTLSNYIPPASVQFTQSSSTAPIMVLFNNILTTPTPPPEPIRTLTTDALKCVPLDPEKQIENGKIKIDASTGKPLDIVQANRMDTMTNALSNTSSVISPQTFIRAVSLVLGVLFFLCIVYFVVAFSMNYFIGNSYAGSHGPIASMSRSVSKFTIPAYFTTGVFMGLAGVLVGYLLSRKAV